MEISKLFVQARSATVQIADGGLYHTKAVYQLFLNGQAAGTADTAVTSLYDLQPETEYVLSVRLGAEEVGRCAFRTARESYTLNVRQFGASATACMTIRRRFRRRFCIARRMGAC